MNYQVQDCRRSSIGCSRGTNEQNKSIGRILLVHRYFHPDVTPYAHMLRVISNHLSREGFNVSVFATQPSYNSVYDGPELPKKSIENDVEVFRPFIPGGGSSFGRFISGIAFGVLLCFHALRNRRKYDVISVSTVPPVVMGLSGTLAAKICGAKLVYHCMDLYPEIAVASHILRRSWITRIASWLDSVTIVRAVRIVVLSNDMVNTIVRRGLPTNNICVLQNFLYASANDDDSVAKTLLKDNGLDFKILFAGNLGQFQGLTALSKGFLLATSRDPVGKRLELIYMGAGAAKGALQKQANESEFGKHISFLDHQPVSTAMAVMQKVQLAVVSLAPNIIASAYPSKTMMYLAMGCRILVIAESDSQLANLVLENDLGVVVPPGDIDELTNAICLEANRIADPGDKKRIQEVANDLFGQESMLSRWTLFYEDIIESEVFS